MNWGSYETVGGKMIQRTEIDFKNIDKEVGGINQAIKIYRDKYEELTNGPKFFMANKEFILMVDCILIILQDELQCLLEIKRLQEENNKKVNKIEPKIKRSKIFKKIKGLHNI